MRYLKEKNQVETRRSGKTNVAPGCVQPHEILCSHGLSLERHGSLLGSLQKLELTISTHSQGEQN